MTDKGALIPPPIPSNQPLDDKFKEALNNAYNGHVDFWKMNILMVNLNMIISKKGLPLLGKMPMPLQFDGSE